MIIEQKSCLKSLIQKISRSLSYHDVVVKRARLYEIFAHSQGFNSKAALDASLPILVNTDQSAMDIFNAEVHRYGAKGKEYKELGSKFLKWEVERWKPFPCIALPEHELVIELDCSSGRINDPYPHYIASRGPTFPDYYGHISTFVLNPVVTEQDFEKLLVELEPLADRVSAGYVYYGDEEHAEFSSDARSALDSVYDFISNFEFEYECRDEPEGTFGHDIGVLFDLYSYLHTPMSVDASGRSAVSFEGDFTISYQTTDKELRHFSASLAVNLGLNHPVHPELFYQYFDEIREACMDNYKHLLEQKALHS